MENAIVVSKTFVLGLKFHCKGCEAKVKRRLQSIQGVHKIEIDSEKGHVTISGTIDPPTLISILGKLSIQAVLLWEQSPPPKEDSISSRSTINGDDNSDHQNMGKIISGSKLFDQFDDSNMVRTFQQLSLGNETHEVTITKTVKVILNEGKMEVVETTNSITTGKNPKVVNNNNNNNSIPPGREEKTVIGTPYLGVENMQGHHCCCQISGHMHHQNQQWPPPPPLGGSAATSAPQMQYEYPPVRPAMVHPPYQSVFSDDNVNGCVII